MTGRGQVAAGLGALALLAGAWGLTRATTSSADGPSLTAATTTAPPPVDGAVPADLLVDTLTTDQADGLRFTDITAEAGLDEPHTAEPPAGDDVTTGGAAVADYDDDGDLDIYLTRLGLPGRLLRNDGTGTFTDVADDAGVEGLDPDSGYAAAVWADVDGDDDLDLLLTGAGRTANLLYVNRGDGTFDEQARERGLQDLGEIKGFLGNASYGATFADWDHDGDLDLVVAQWYTEAVFVQPDLLGGPDGDRVDLCSAVAAIPAPEPGAAPTSRTRFYENDGTGHFADITTATGVAVDRIVAFQPTFADVDGDGWEDLLVTGDACTSKLYRNEQGRRFTDITRQAGLGTDENGMGSVVEDLDGDGDLDWFISAIALPTGDEACPVRAPTFACSGNRLFLGDGRGSFTDATDRIGVRDGSWGWGAVGADLDSDGHRDLFLVNGYRVRLDDPNGQRDLDARWRDRFDGDRNRLWLGRPEGAWPQGAAVVGIDDRANGKAVVAFDADGDLDLDLLIANTEGAPILYRNDTPAAGRHRLVLRLHDPGSTNPDAIGATVRVVVGPGHPDQLASVRAGGSFQSSDPTDVNVGLGDADAVERVEITWPGGGAPQVLTDVAVDEVVTVERPAA